ncbi:MAG: tRNA (adenosine(37)-N6)-threonylcarbamoyltransferase complex dimerization subunit type 1 TsaB [Ruminococcus sp.]|nr:tRNA (adenosine(37)-N6)-threonylcarbamoyltransferase complex dimerization subunit type 1 TsaB [Ruminococcus sp.]
MTILAIDSSAKAASVCIANEEKIIGEFFINTSLTHSQTLMPMTEQLLKNTEMTIDDVDAIAVNSGPGSFTGVRIGVAAAKGLAFPKNLPCVSVSTLESMAYNLLGTDCVVCAVMDARCSQVYNAMFRIKGETVERLTDDRALSLSDLLLEFKQTDERILIVGDGAEITYDFLKNEASNAVLAPKNRRTQTASSVALAAFQKLFEGKTQTAAELMPIYLRLPQAQRELNARLRNN